MVANVCVCVDYSLMLMLMMMIIIQTFMQIGYLLETPMMINVCLITSRQADCFFCSGCGRFFLLLLLFVFVMFVKLRLTNQTEVRRAYPGTQLNHDKQRDGKD